MSESIKTVEQKKEFIALLDKVNNDLFDLQKESLDKLWEIRTFLNKSLYSSSVEIWTDYDALKKLYSDIFGKLFYVKKCTEYEILGEE